MPGLEELFAFGRVSKVVNIGGNEIRLVAIDVNHVQDALNASYALDDVAKFIEYKKQVLARAITHCNGITYIDNAELPKSSEIESTLKILNQFPIVLINTLYDFYDEMDTEVKKNLDDKVKK